MRNTILGDLSSPSNEVDRLRRQNAALRNRVTWLQLQLALHGLEVIDEPEKVVTRTVPARLEVRRVKR